LGVAPADQPAVERAKQERKDYLLRPMRKAQLAVLDEVLDRSVRAVEMILEKGPGPAMNEFNRTI
jgi:peptidyl-tRNA hydrolase, PTH1 family